MAGIANGPLAAPHYYREFSPSNGERVNQPIEIRGGNAAAICPHCKGFYMASLLLDEGGRLCPWCARSRLQISEPVEGIFAAALTCAGAGSEGS